LLSGGPSLIAVDDGFDRSQFMTAVPLSADCSQCAALCCVALAFDRGPMFAIDKANGEVCRHLDNCGQCRIHAELERSGFKGCVQYDCLGAGQRVTQEVFGGRSWQDDADLLAPMMRAFETMRIVHEQLLLLREAEKLPLSAVERAERARLQAMLEPDGGWSQTALALFDAAKTKADVRAFLMSLRQHVKAKT
jgi:hypothetical protein